MDLAKLSEVISIIYWADTDLQFISDIRQIANAKDRKVCFTRISHHKSWFTKKKSYLSNFIHLACIFLSGIASGLGGTVVVFGTNACRIVFLFRFLFRNSFFIFNEIPDGRSIVFGFYDRLIFSSLGDKLYVSNSSRAKYLKEQYRLTIEPPILSNIPSPLLSVASKKSAQRSGAVFGGTLTEKRINAEFEQVIQTIQRISGGGVEVIGPRKSMRARSIDGVIFVGELTRKCYLERLKNYKIGILSYYLGEPNYDLCAPLKIYEYLAAGLVVVSVNRNRSLQEINQRFGKIIYFCDELEHVNFDNENYSSISEKFIRFALDDNRAFANRVVV